MSRVIVQSLRVECGVSASRNGELACIETVRLGWCGARDESALDGRVDKCSMLCGSLNVGWLCDGIGVQRLSKSAIWHRLLGAAVGGTGSCERGRRARTSSSGFELHSWRPRFLGIFGLFLAFLLIFAAGCDRSRGRGELQSATVADAHRVVVLSPAAAVIVRDLGFADRVVGRHVYDAVLPKDIPACGDQGGIDYEALIRVKPTLVITQWGARALPEKFVALAEESGWSVLDVNPLNLEQIAEATVKIGAAISDDEAVKARAAELAGRVRACGVYEKAVGEVGSRQAPRVLMIVGVSPITALGPGSCHHEILIGAGARSVLSEGLAYQTLTNEDLVRLSPDGIILFDPRSESVMNAGEDGNGSSNARGDVWKPIRGLGLGAIEAGRVGVIDDPLSLMPSTAMIEVSERVRGMIREWERDERK